MQKLKTAYFIIALILFITFGFLAVIPQVIPSWETTQKILVETIYIFNLVLAYIIIKRFQKNFFSHFSKKKEMILTIATTLFFAISLTFMFVATSLGFGQGFMGATLEKEYNYPKYKTTIYVYDAGFLDPATAFKIRRKFLPLMKDVKFIGNWLPNKVKEFREGDYVKFSFQKDTIKISLKTGKLITK